MERRILNITTPDKITWHVEQEGTGPDIVLVPDGYGECELFSKPMSIIASKGFRVTTFDMPGMSRSANAAPETYQEVTAQKLAQNIVTLLEKLEIEVATFFGCSSGACTVLALVTDHPQRVRNVMSHEAPTLLLDHLSELAAKDDDEIVKSMESMQAALTGSAEVWDGLDKAVHGRLRRNYPRWARGYPLTIPPSTPINDLEKLKQRPTDWTIGAMTPTMAFLSNIITAVKIDAPVTTLPGNHFPYLSHPTEFAEYVAKTTEKYTS